MSKMFVHKIEVKKTKETFVSEKGVTIITSELSNGVWASDILELSPYVVGYGYNAESAVNNMLMSLSDTWKYYVSDKELDHPTKQIDELKRVVCNMIKKVEC